MRGTAVVGLGLALAACGGGGELADETMRRSAEQALDSTPQTAVPVDSGYRVPAFVEGGAPPAVPQDGAPDPSPRWTTGVSERSLPGARGVATVRDIRVGRNEGFDRLVIGFGDDPVPAYRIEYVPPPLRGCGSGEPIGLDGRAVLHVQLRMTQAHDDQGRVTVPRAEIRADMPVVRQVKLVCDFEGEVGVALGTERANAYRVLIEESPNRLIVDVRQ